MKTYHRQPEMFEQNHFYATTFQNSQKKTVVPYKKLIDLRQNVNVPCWSNVKIGLRTKIKDD